MTKNQPIEISPELLGQARAAKSADEIAALAREQGIDMTDAEAEAIYATLHETEGEIADEELDNVAGGGGCGQAPNEPCGCGTPYHRVGSQWYHSEADGYHYT